MKQYVNPEVTYVEFNCDCGKTFVISKNAIYKNGIEKQCECGRTFLIKQMYLIESMPK